jgi:hypothetical protein
LVYGLVNSINSDQFKGIFENMVAVAFQNDFHTEMYQNNIFFYFLKIIFEISASKRYKTYKKINF